MMSKKEDFDLLEVLLLGYHKEGVLCACGHTTANHFEFDVDEVYQGVRCSGFNGTCKCSQFVKSTNIDYILARERFRREKL